MDIHVMYISRMVRNVPCDNYRAQLEVKTSHVAPPTSGDQTTPTQSKSDDIIRITQLEDQLERSQDQSRALERQVAQLKHSLHCLEQQSRGTQQSVGQIPQSREGGGLTAEEMEVQQEKHEVYGQQTASTRTLGLDWDREMMYIRIYCMVRYNNCGQYRASLDSIAICMHSLVSTD